MTRGGKRKGAGRPPRKTPWASISLKVEPALLRAWNAAKRKRRLSGPKLLALLLTAQFEATGKALGVLRARLSGQNL